jgi:hypothetical protein
MCGTDICPIHTRTDAHDDYSEGVVFRAVDYVGGVAVVTGESPEFSSPFNALLDFFSSQAGIDTPVPPMFLTLVIKIGEGAIGEAMEELQSNLLLEQTHGDFGKVSGLSGSEMDAAMSVMANEGHSLVLDQVKGGMFSSE